MQGEIIGYEEIYINESVVGLNPAVYSPTDGSSASKAFITSEGGDMRYRVDGQDPTPSTGHLLLDSDFLELESIYLIQKFRAVKAGIGTPTGKISVSYEV